MGNLASLPKTSSLYNHRLAIACSLYSERDPLTNRDFEREVAGILASIDKGNLKKTK